MEVGFKGRRLGVVHRTGHGDFDILSGSAPEGRHSRGRGVWPGVQRTVRQTEGRGDRPVGNPPPVNIHTVGDSGIARGQSLPTILY